MAKETKKAEAAVDMRALRNAMSKLANAVATINSAAADITASGHATSERLGEIAEKIVKRVAVIQRRIDPDAAAKRETEKKRKKITKMEEKLAALKAEVGN